MLKLLNRRFFRRSTKIRFVSTRIDAIKNVESDSSQSIVNVYGRLSVLHKLLTDKTSKFKYSTSECMQLYNYENASIIQDMFSREKVNEPLISLFFRHYHSYRPIKFLLLNDLQVLWNKKNNALIGRFIARFMSSKMMDIEVIDFTKSELDSDEAANFIVQFAALSGEPLIACLSAISFRNNNSIKLHTNTIGTLLRCITSYNGIELKYYSFAIMRLVDTFHDYKFDNDEMAKIIEFTMDEKDAFFPNLIYSKLCNRIESTDSNSERLGNALILLIKLNISLGQINQAFEIWKRSLNHQRVYRDAMILRELIQKGDKSQADFIIKVSEINQNHLLQESVIRYYGSQPDKWSEIQHIISQIKPPIQRSTLSALFEVLLSQGKDVESQKVLDTILNSKGQLEPQDLNSIVSHLLKNGNLEKSIDLITDTDVGDSRDAYMTVLKYLLLNNQQGKSLSFIKEMCLSLQNKPCESILPILTEFFVKNNILIGRSFVSKILNHTKCMKSSDLNNLPNLEIWGMTNDLYKIILLSSRSVQSALYIILDMAISKDNLDVMKWCVSELRYNGTSVKEILRHIKGQNAEIYSKYFD